MKSLFYRANIGNFSEFVNISKFFLFFSLFFSLLMVEIACLVGNNNLKLPLVC